MASGNHGITPFYLPSTHKPYLPLLLTRKALPPFGLYSLRLTPKGWPGWVDLGGWSHTEITVGMLPATWRLCNPTTRQELSRKPLDSMENIDIIGLVEGFIRHGRKNMLLGLEGGVTTRSVKTAVGFKCAVVDNRVLLVPHTRLLKFRPIIAC